MHFSSGLASSRSEIKVEFTADDLAMAFGGVVDQGLFFSLNQPDASWLALPISARLSVFAAVAKVVEAEIARREAEELSTLKVAAKK